MVQIGQRRNGRKDLNLVFFSWLLVSLESALMSIDRLPYTDNVYTRAFKIFSTEYLEMHLQQLGMDWCPQLYLE